MGHVSLNEKLWDGARWVKHDGVIKKGRQRVISVNGVRMTPDHRVLTDHGWIPAWDVGGYFNPAQGSNISFDVSYVYDEDDVYDIMNAGPDHRFAVISHRGLMIVHNCVQAIARDCLCEAIERLEAAGFPIVFHVHDEVVIDIKPYADDDKMLQDVCDIMRQPPAWAPDLPLNAAGWVGDFFTKD